MSDLNAQITTESARLLQIAKAILRKPIRQLVQEAIDSHLKANGITPEKFLGQEKQKR